MDQTMANYIAKKEAQFDDTIKQLREDAAKNEARYEQTIKMLREDSKKKDEMNERLLNEISNLRSQLAELTQRLEPNNTNGNSSASSAANSPEEEAVLSENESQSEEEAMDQTMTEEKFERTQNRREKRKKRFNHSSSDEEATVKRTPQSQEGKIRTPQSQEEKKSKSETGQSKKLDFPPLPPSKATKSPIKTTQIAPTPAATPVATPQKSQATPATRSAKIPPIVIRDKKKYNTLTAAFTERKFDYGRGVTIPEGIRIHPPTIEDFRHITRFLDNQKEPYHTYALEEEKLNRILIRGINEGATIDEITDDLNRQGHFPKRVIRWFHKSGDPMAIVLALMPKEDKKIFALRYLCKVGVRIETQRNQGRSTQCFNCQLHGHSALRCRAPPKCVKCGEGHQSSTCPRSKDQPATCANCGGPHPSSYGGCPKHPKNQRANASAPKPQFIWGKQDNSQLASSTQDPAVTKQVTDFNAALQQLFKNLANMQSQFPSFMNLVNIPTQ